MVTCLACGAGDTSFWARARDVEYHTVANSFDYHRCGRCGALSIDPVPDHLELIYPQTYYSFGNRGAGLVEMVKDQLDSRWFRRVTSHLGGRLRALDVGGGSGRQLDTLRKAVPRVERTTVVDLDAGAEAAAIARGHAFVRSRFEDAALDGPFDVILMLNLLEHVADPMAVLSRARDLLSAGGVILLKTPNYESLDARLFRHSSWGGYHCPRHWVIFNRASLERLVDRAGLAIRELRFTQGAPFWSVSIIAWLADRGLARVSAQRPAHRHPLYAPLVAGCAAADFLRRPFAPLSQMILALRAA